MPTNTFINVDKLKLDLKNYRTIPQESEESAINAMIAIKPDRFFAVLESIIDYGYLVTENLIVLKHEDNFIVKEGNRRVASLFLITGRYDKNNFSILEELKQKIELVDQQWRISNSKIPCTIFNIDEIDQVDKIVNLAHAKGEKASRDPWTSVARARHHRDEKGGQEYALDLLEKYINVGKNITLQQRERWSGDYPLTVLEEALRKIIHRLDFNSTLELINKYPTISNRRGIEELIRDIGLNIIQFKNIRDANLDFAIKYGVPKIDDENEKDSKSEDSKKEKTEKSKSESQKSTKDKAYATNDPKYVAKLLRTFSPQGENRQKVVTLRDEIKKLAISKNPIAFCFILRSMFEISAKAYCIDNSIELTKSNGNDKTLANLLREITNHLTNNNSNKGMVKVLHGAIVQIEKPQGILSVTSMNQLVHNPSFSVTSSDICSLFSNIYPLLEAMN